MPRRLPPIAADAPPACGAEEPERLSFGRARQLVLAALRPARVDHQGVKALIAVSGGPDSLALLLLAGRERGFFAAHGISFAAATVDHRLRPESADEAAYVASVASSFDIPHATFVWSDRERGGNLSDQAREARYRLLEEAARRQGAAAILLAHHLDDQIETHLLARDRGAGPLALAGMRACRELSPGLLLIRPFLGIEKRDLGALVAREGLAPAMDPTNADPAYSRVRVRQAVAGNEALRRDALRALSVASAKREALERDLAAALEPLLRGGNLAERDGVVLLARASFRALPPELREMLLSRIVTAAGGGRYPPSRVAIRRLAESLAAGGTGATLGGCLVRADARWIRFLREYGRAGPADIEIPSGAGTVIFDNRFEISMSPFRPADEALRLVPLGRLGRGGFRERCLPVLLDVDRRPIAAHPAALPRLPQGLRSLDTKSRVAWRLLADLRNAGGNPLVRLVPPAPLALTGSCYFAAKAPCPVGNEMVRHYLSPDGRTPPAWTS